MSRDMLRIQIKLGNFVSLTRFIVFVSKSARIM